MVDPLLSRRGVLRLGAATGLTALAGCSRQGPQLVASRGDLPTTWSASLPGPWQLRLLDSPSLVVAAPEGAGGARSALLQLSDGWAVTVPADRLQPFAQPSLFSRLSPMAAPVSRLFQSPGSPPLAFPFSYAPWVLLLRSRPDLVERRQEGWNLLLDPSLTGRVVLPSSPRVVIALCQGDEERLGQLRRQALAHDDRNALNLVLARDADAAVLPRSRVIPLLRRDARLRALLPESGSPLSWNLLLRPASTRATPPLDWLEEALMPPLLARLLAAGFVPPLPREQLQRALGGFPDRLADLLLPPQAVLDRCFSLEPLAARERRRLQELWDAAAPNVA
jgi:putative spermidine/putrescine transport system substrate-binding protein